MKRIQSPNVVTTITEYIFHNLIWIFYENASAREASIYNSFVSLDIIARVNTNGGL